MMTVSGTSDREHTFYHRIRPGRPIAKPADIQPDRQTPNWGSEPNSAKTRHLVQHLSFAQSEEMSYCISPVTQPSVKTLDARSEVIL